MTLYITADLNNQPVELRFRSDQAELVETIAEIASVSHGRIIHPWEMICLFPDRPELHKRMSEAEAMIAAGCVQVET